MFLTKLSKYTDLVRASNTRVDAESGQRLQIVCRGNPPEMGFSESDPDKLKSFSTFLPNPKNSLLNNLSPCIFFLSKLV